MSAIMKLRVNEALRNAMRTSQMIGASADVFSEVIGHHFVFSLLSFEEWTACAAEIEEVYEACREAAKQKIRQIHAARQ